MLDLGLKVLLAYLIGALNGALVLLKILGGTDVRTVGSGNAGGTNALRARGKWFALGTLLIDVGKGFLVVALLPSLLLPGVDNLADLSDPAVPQSWIVFGCAAAVIVGHCFPVWFGFAGGKGAATALGALAALSPPLLWPLVLTWALVVTTTGFVGLATILATAVLPAFVALTRWPQDVELFLFLVALALFILYTHRGNVTRMLRSEENRMTGLMLLRRSR